MSHHQKSEGKYVADNGYAKLKIALAKGKKEYDKRATIREKDIRREMERE